jgi:hypothetical protein
MAGKGLQGALDFHRQLHLAILKVLLQTSKMAAAEQRPAPQVRTAAPESLGLPAIPNDWTVPPKLAKRYGEGNMQPLHTWWTECGLGMVQGSQPLVYISGIQLFYSFQLHTGHLGPWCSKKRWYAEEEGVPVQARLSWGSRCSLFLRMWRCYLKQNGLVIPTKMARPSSTSIAKWLVCFKLRWRPEDIDQVDQIILAQTGRQLCSNVDMAGLRAARTS